MNQGVGSEGERTPFPRKRWTCSRCFSRPRDRGPREGAGVGGGREQWAVWQLRAWGGDTPAFLLNPRTRRTDQPRKDPLSTRECSVAAGCGVVLGVLRSLATSGPRASLGGVTRFCGNNLHSCSSLGIHPRPQNISRGRPSQALACVSLLAAPWVFSMGSNRDAGATGRWHLLCWLPLQALNSLRVMPHTLLPRTSRRPTPPPWLRDLHDTPFSHGLTPHPHCTAGHYIQEHTLWAVSTDCSKS